MNLLASKHHVYREKQGFLMASHIWPPTFLSATNENNFQITSKEFLKSPNSQELTPQLNPSLVLLQRLIQDHKLEHEEHNQPQVEITTFLTNFYEVEFIQPVQQT